MRYTVIVEMVFEEESALEAVIGTHHVREGLAEVEVASTGTQVGEVVSMAVTGELPHILEWMIEEWQDAELAAQEFAEAITHGHLTDAE